MERWIEVGWACFGLEITIDTSKQMSRGRAAGTAGDSAALFHFNSPMGVRAAARYRSLPPLPPMVARLGMIYEAIIGEIAKLVPEQSFIRQLSHMSEPLHAFVREKTGS